MKKKRAFTMVELIFVIVILGILAAVAVPRLNASREDAQIAQIIANVRTLMNDVDSYFAANGKIEQYLDFRKVSNVVQRYDGKGSFYDFEGKECLRIYAEEENCMAYHYFKDRTHPACIKAFEKMDFLRGDNRGAKSTGYCDGSLPENIVHINKATPLNNNIYGVLKHFDKPGVEWD